MFLYTVCLPEVKGMFGRAGRGVLRCNAARFAFRDGAFRSVAAAGAATVWQPKGCIAAQHGGDHAEFCLQQ